MEINNIEQLIELKKLKWTNSYTQRDFEVTNIEEFKYLLENYLNKFAFGVTYNTFEYTIYKKDDYIYIRNNDTYKFKNKYEGVITEEYNLKDDNIKNIIDFIISSQDKNDNRRTRIKFIYIDVDDITNEIEQLLDKGLIKYFYGKDDCQLEFIYLAENENIIKDTLTSEYFIKDIIEQMSMIFEGMYMTVKNVWRDEVYVPDYRIIDLIEDNLYGYIPEDDQKKIFNAEIPNNKLKTIFNEIGKNQLRMQIEELLTDVDNTEFI
ncbi:hypothetical protein [Clostridium sporogenes]|uniref:hypothetical protein n=1 Tax=Clostridium sporogenes TaxID=1509 RepID=UPI0013D3D439|nr:hypothetical protein [Clostridium sporogenes]NFH40758.1 hypothetical protein [Clostridium sporogenes]